MVIFPSFFLVCKNQAGSRLLDHLPSGLGKISAFAPWLGMGTRPVIFQRWNVETLKLRLWATRMKGWSIMINLFIYNLYIIINIYIYIYMARMASCYPWSASMSAEQFMFHQSWYVVHKSLSQTMSRGLILNIWGSLWTWRNEFYHRILMDSVKFQFSNWRFLLNRPLEKKHSKHGIVLDFWLLKDAIRVPEVWHSWTGETAIVGQWLPVSVSSLQCLGKPTETSHGGFKRWEIIELTRGFSWIFQCHLWDFYQTKWDYFQLHSICNEFH